MLDNLHLARFRFQIYNIIISYLAVRSITSAHHLRRHTCCSALRVKRRAAMEIDEAYSLQEEQDPLESAVNLEEQYAPDNSPPDLQADLV